MEYDNTNSGVLFKNNKKETEKHPDYTGKVNVEGKEMRLAAWIKEGKAGKFMSLKLSYPQGDPQSIATPMQQIVGLDDSIPF
jgi:uncharacterized protein (DUF736 family)